MLQRILFLLLAVSGSRFLTSDPIALAAERPNMILIIADDLGAEDCGPFGNPRVRTPQLDRLAREGLRCDRAFVTTSSCSPSRASLLTGRYPHQTGAEQLHWPLPAEQVGFTELLRNAGYWTAAAGKWHLGEAAKLKFDLVREANAGAARIPENADESTKLKSISAAKSGCADWVPTLRDRPRDKPFFLWLAAFDPHRTYDEGTIPEPHQPSDAVVPPYLPDTPAVRKDLALYYDEIARLDRNVGDVLDELDRQHIARDTLVVFLSDNGRPFPRCKTTIYDSGIRTPLLIRWPARVPAHSVSRSLISSIDLAPTFLALAGVEAPPSFAGRNLLPLLTDPTRVIRTEVFAEHNWHNFEARGRTIRTERFAYIRNDYRDVPNTPPSDVVRSPTFREMQRLRDAGQLPITQTGCFTKPLPKEELYDLESDPDELRNLASDPRFDRALRELRAALDAWGRETDDRVPKARTPDDSDRETGEPLATRERVRKPPQDRTFEAQFSIP